MNPVVLSGLVACTWVAPTPEPTPVPSPRHVVVVSLDTTRADQPGAYGGPAHTPRIDAFARESLVFTSHVSTASTTLASHTALMTGTWPHRHGAPSNSYVVSDANVLLAERLAEAGFTTAAILGAMPLGSHTGFTQGFGTVDEDFVHKRGTEHEQAERPADQVTDAALAWASAHASERLFLFVHYFDPHVPYAPPEPWRSREGDHPAAVGSLAHLKAMRNRSAGARQAEVAHLEALYRAELSWTDHQLGRLLDGLDEVGILDAALVVLTADHGETFTEHPHELFDHGYTAYHTTVHTPLVLRLPGGATGRTDHLVSNIDVAPTVLSVLGLPAEGTQGTPFTGLLHGEPVPARGPVFAEATRSTGPDPAATGWRNAPYRRMVREGHHALHQDGTTGAIELYDLAIDPLEQHDLSADPSHRRRAEHLERVLDAWADAADPLPTRALTEPEIRDLLETLGYAE